MLTLSTLMLVLRLHCCTCAADVDDVVKALQFASQYNLRTAVLGAGHQVVGVQLLPNGLTIDVKNLSQVQVNAEAQTAYVGAGVPPLLDCKTWCAAMHSNQQTLRLQHAYQ